MRSLAFTSLCLAIVLSVSFSSYAGTSTAVPMKSHPIEVTDWSFECVNGSSCGASTDTWITTTSQPGTTRLWDAGVTWSDMNNGSDSYNWTNLDTWLDLVAAHQPTAVIYTFGHVPCFITSVACNQNANGDSKYWSGGPPTDLTSKGSDTFNAYVTQLTQHCSAAGNCVKDYIKYWELWNEHNLTHYWSGSVTQMYDMLKPAVAIIRANVSGAIVSTPAICGGGNAWMTSWLATENSQGKLSDYYGFHTYLYGYEPETRMNEVMSFVAIKNDAGWTTTPWMNTETNFSVETNVCTSTVEDCDGQIVRWHVLQFAYQGGGGGAFHVGWYNWPSISSGGYDTYYYTMMQWLSGSTFSASCSSSGTIYTCPLTEADGSTALIVWNSSGNSSYTPASEYVDYRSFNGTYGGTKTTISSGEETTIGLIPIMFETTK